MWFIHITWKKNYLCIMLKTNKQRFEVIVIPQDLSKVVLKLAHDDLGHNGSARTYMIVRRNYYWKGLRPDVVHYVKRCTVCRKTQILHHPSIIRELFKLLELPWISYPWI